MGLHRLVGLRVGVPDPEALASFYGEVGLTSDGCGGFAGTDGGVQVEVAEHPFRRLLGVEITATDERSLAEGADRLAVLGLSPQLLDGALSVLDPVSQVAFRVEVGPGPPPAPSVARHAENGPGRTERRNERAAGVLSGARPPRRLGHLVIGTPDLARTRSVLVDGLGFKVSDELDGIIAFLRCSTDHHNVALVGSPVPLLQHYSWECDDVDHVGHLATALLRVDEDRQVWGFGRHHIGSNFFWYLRDPSGSFIELYSDMDVIDDDDEWERRGRTPVGFEHVANAWGPSIPAEFIVPDDLEALQAGWAGQG